MAEYKLGRIRFIWKDQWAAGTTYLKDDVVRKNGKVYICVIGHTAASDFYVDADNIPARWNQMSDGQTWRSDWSPDTVYYLNDIVKYGGQVYICTQGHTSAATYALGLEQDLDLGDSTVSKWHIFAESFDWKNDWVPNYRYKRHDIVKYGGNTYLCNTGHTSASDYTYGLEGLGLVTPGVQADIGKWDLYSESFEWKTDWAPSTRYKLHDVVRFGGTTYVCNLGHTSAATFDLGLEADQTKWDYFNQGIQYLYDWDNGDVNYKINDVVKYGGDLWICTKKHKSNTSTLFQTEEAAGRWKKFVEGLKFQDSWNSSTVYEPGDIVTYGGYAYVAKTNHSNVSPIAAVAGGINWSLYTTGFTLKNNWDQDTNYKVGEVVRLNGYSYACIADTTKYTTTVTATSQSTGQLTINNSLATTTSTATTSVTVNSVTYNYVRVNSGTGLSIGRSIVFTGTTFGGITANQTYYIVGLPTTTPQTIVSVAQASTIVTVTTNLVHGYTAGQTVTVTGTSLVDAANVVITAVPNAYTFTYDLASNTVPTTTVSGTVTPAAQIIISSSYNGSPLTLTTASGSMGVSAGETYFVGQAIRFSGTTFGNIQTGSTPKQTYWIYSVDGLNTLKISTTQYGSPVSTTATGTNGQSTITVTSLTGIALGFQVTGNGIGSGATVVSIVGYVVTLSQPNTSNITTGTGAITFSSYFVPQTQTGSMTAEIVAEPPNDTFWGRLNSGIKWTNSWVTDIDYFLGDAVRYGPNSYICIQQHHSLTSNRPDNDVTGTFWNLLANGQESSVLTTQGDLVYFGGSGPTRLPIGQDGQVLTVNGNTLAPNWKFWGSIDQVYYVATSGTDSAYPIYGATLDKPWKTIRYACEQILAGPRNPNAAYLINVNRQFIQRETVNWINYQIANNISPFTTGFTYDQTKCERDTGYVIDALVWDLTHGGNVRSRAAALSYVGGTYTLLSSQKTQTNAALNYAINNVLVAAVLANAAPFQNYQVLNGVAVGSRINQVINTNYTSETVSSDITALLKIITDAITAGVSTNIPAQVQPNYTILAKTGVYYETLPIVVPAFTAIVGDELRSTNIRPAASQVAAGDVTYSLAALAYIKTIISNVVTGTTVTTNQITYSQDKTLPLATGTEGTTVQNLVQNIIDYINFYINSTGSAPAMTGTNTPASTYDPYAAARLLELNRNFIVAQTNAYIAATYPAYSYNVASCSRDVNRYIDALKYDLVYTGNYKTLTYAKLYVNAVTGSLLQNMFLVRNACGLRNCTVQGLTGTLGSANAYGTKRPSAGAYVSLDPGYGPNDSDAWVTTRSTYVQNVTTFGTAAIGLKIDGNLHNGGNKSVVANDFTQVISDGIGVWCTNNGLTELVSVFSYYGHMGYLAEAGGKIRATNGNSSYGDYGTVSEGVDATEVPITAQIDNRASAAQVGLTVQNGNAIQRLEFTNAGINYNNSATFTFNGAGINAAAVFDETRDNAIFEARQLQLAADGSDGMYGGSSYYTAQNVAQAGGLYQITLAATDSQTSSGYLGMRIVTVSGTGAAQQAKIINYNAGNKIALVAKESFADITVTGSTISGNTLTTTAAEQDRLYANMPLYLSAAIGGLSANSLYYVVGSSIATPGTTFQVSTAPSGSAATITATTTGQNVTLYQAGWEGAINGTTITSPDPSTLYLIEPRVTFAAPGFKQNATGTLPTVAVGYKDGVFSQTRSTHTGVSASGGAGSSATFNITRVGLVYTVTLNNGGTGYAVGNTLTILGTSVDGATPRNDITITVTKVTSPTGVISAFSSTGLGRGGQFFALPNSGATGAYSRDGSTWTSTTITNQSWGTVATGTISNVDYVQILPGSGSANFQYSTNGGQTWTSSTLPTTQSWTSSAFGNGVFMAVSSTSNTPITSSNGTSWAVTAGNLGAFTNLVGVAYGLGRFMVLPGSAANTTASYSLNNGTTFVATTLPSSQTWSGIAYGNGRFVAIASTNRAGAISIDGVNWTAVTLPNGTMTKIRYAQGLFMMITSGSANTVWTSQDGINWTNRTFATSDTRAFPFFGDPNNVPSWIVLPSSATTTGIIAKTGATATGRVLVTNNSISQTRIVEPGSGYPFGSVTNVGPTTTITVTSVSGTTITTSTNLTTAGILSDQPIVFSAGLGNIVGGSTYYVLTASGTSMTISSSLQGTAFTVGTASGTITGTTASVIKVDQTDNLVNGQPVNFTNLAAVGLSTNKAYYVISGSITTTSFRVSQNTVSSTAATLTTPASSLVNAFYNAGGAITITDPNRVFAAPIQVRAGSSVLANPTFTNRGTLWTTATTTISGDGVGDIFQPGQYISIKNISSLPTVGSNVEFASLPGQYFKLVTTRNLIGTGPYTATFQISPLMSVTDSPPDGDAITVRIRYSQVRLTGHDFLSIGTGNFTNTNYPGIPLIASDSAKQTKESAGGRVFFTSTDQDGNFNVGNLFSVQQATGTATLNANAFNLAGLQSLSLGSVNVGGSAGATITEFSTDPYFTANSDAILPTQRAIKAYVASQIGSGSSTLNVNTLTAGSIFVSGNTITTTTNLEIKVTTKLNFIKGVDGYPVALNLFLT